MYENGNSMQNNLKIIFYIILFNRERMCAWKKCYLPFSF